MFGIASRRARRAANADSARLTDLATQFGYYVSRAREAESERRLWVIPAAIALTLSLLFLALAVASANSVGWDIGAPVPTGRNNGTGPLWVVLVFRVALAVLLAAVAVGFRITAQRSIRTSRRQLAEFSATHAADLGAIEVLHNERASAEAILDARVREERLRPTGTVAAQLDDTAAGRRPSAARHQPSSVHHQPSSAQLLAAVPPALAPELRRVLAGVKSALTKRRVLYVLGTVFIAVGLFAMSFGIVPANDNGWMMGTEMPGGRLDGTLPLWFVFTVAMLIGVLIVAGGVAYIVSGWSAVRTAKDRLLRLRIEHNVLWPAPAQSPARSPE